MAHKPDKSESRQRKPTTVKVFGREYRIRSDETDESVQRIARFVDEKMQETARRAQAADPVGVAVLAAMNIAGEYFPARADREATAGITAERVRRLIQVVDGSLAQTGPARGSSRARH